MSNVLAFLGRDMAVDLGTANTLVYVRGRGIVLNEPSVVALNTNTGQIVAVGLEAKRMIGRTPGNIMAVRPLKDGVIADFDVTERMLRYFIQKVHRRGGLAKPRIVIAVPSGITGVEQSAVKEAGHQAGARRVYIIEEPMAAAIGAGLPVNEPTGNMVVDIGGGTTEVAVISLGGIVTALPICIGGDEMDQAIITFGKKEYSLMLGERTAEEIKMALGSAFPSADEPHAEIRGRDLVSGLPKTIVISAEEIRRAIEEPINLIVDAVKTTLDKCPPELAGDVMDRGIALTGGGALLRGLDEGVEAGQVAVHLLAGSEAANAFASVFGAQQDTPIGGDLKQGHAAGKARDHAMAAIQADGVDGVQVAAVIGAVPDFAAIGSPTQGRDIEFGRLAGDRSQILHLPGAIHNVQADASAHGVDGVGDALAVGRDANGEGREWGLGQHLTHRVLETILAIDRANHRHLHRIGRPVGQADVLQQLAELAASNGIARQGTEPIGSERSLQEGQIALGGYGQQPALGKVETARLGAAGMSLVDAAGSCVPVRGIHDVLPVGTEAGGGNAALAEGDAMESGYGSHGEAGPQDETGDEAQR